MTTIKNLIEELQKFPEDTKIEDMDIMFQELQEGGERSFRRIKDVNFICNIHERSNNIKFPQLIIQIIRFEDHESMAFLDKKESLKTRSKSLLKDRPVRIRSSNEFGDPESPYDLNHVARSKRKKK